MGWQSQAWKPITLLLGGCGPHSDPSSPLPHYHIAAWGPSGGSVSPHQEAWDSQNIADDSDAPHVCGVADGFIVDHFRSHKLRGPKEDLQRPSVL